MLCFDNSWFDIDVWMQSLYLFLFSTSATSSSVENWPRTTRIKFLMTSSEQSTSRSPPITTGRRLGFTYIYTNKDHLPFVHCLTTAAMWTEVKLTHLLHIDFDVFLEVVSIQVEYKIMNEVEAIAHNNERQLVGEFSFLSVKWWGNEKMKSFVQ